MAKHLPEAYEGNLRKHFLRVPEAIYAASGIVVFGKRIKSLVFTTDLSIIRNVNADAVIAVYPFTPQPLITQGILLAADIPVFVGVGGGITTGKRTVNMAMYAEMQGASGVVLNSPTENSVIEQVADVVDVPVIITVTRKDTDIAPRLEAGASFVNVSVASDTPEVVAKIRAEYPDLPIIATGGPTDETISTTIAAGANAITWTPPSCADILSEIMKSYREN